MKKVVGQNGIAPADMFFDRESRSIGREHASEENESAARALQMQLQLCQMLNRAGMSTAHAGIGGPAGQSDGQSAAASEMASRMVALPTDQEVAPHAPAPQTRTDLEPLLRLSVDFMCTAVGVPASLLFDGRFEGKTSDKLALLNATVAQLAAAVDQVLTDSFLDLYPEETTAPEKAGAAGSSSSSSSSDGRTRATTASAGTKRKLGHGARARPVELVTTTSPLSATEEVLALFQGGIADFEAAAPVALHSIGLSAIEIEAAIERRRQEDAEAKTLAEEDRATSKETQRMALEAQKASLEAGVRGGENAVAHLTGAGRAVGGSAPASK